jgi:kynureninase
MSTPMANEADAHRSSPERTASGMRRPSQAAAEALDQADPLRTMREEFQLPPGRIYLDGNSLGPLSHAAQTRVQEVVQREWGTGLIQSWNACDWMGMPERLGARIARLLGCRAEEVIVTDSTSINLFKLALAYCRSTPRRKIVTELGNFPTDLYVLQGLAELLEVELCAVPRGNVLQAIDSSTALVVLTHVHYRTAEMFDLAGVTRHAHAAGAAMLWDLSHSVGAMPLALDAAGPEFAVGCTYKYLNGGPGAPAFLYIRHDMQERIGPAIAGWLGHAEPFDFSDEYRPAHGIRRHRCGTPGVLGMAALDGSLGVFEDTDMQQVREKSVALTTFFMEAVAQECRGHDLQLVSPADAAERGSHVSYRHPHGYEIMQALIARGVIGDFRAPDVLRFGFAPLYLRYVDAWAAATTLRDVLEIGTWRHAPARLPGSVT